MVEPITHGRVVVEFTKWRASDGSEWDTEEQACKQEAVLKLAKFIDALTCFGTIDPSDLLDALTTGKLGDEVMAYRKTYC